MLFGYLTLIFEVSAHIFRAIGVCAILLPIAYFLGFVALDRCDGMTAILGLMAVASVIMAAASVYMELGQAMEEIQSFRYWRAAVKNI